jgi:hypothetical protein
MPVHGQQVGVSRIPNVRPAHLSPFRFDTVLRVGVDNTQRAQPAFGVITGLAVDSLHRMLVVDTIERNCHHARRGAPGQCDRRPPLCLATRDVALPVHTIRTAYPSGSEPEVSVRVAEPMAACASVLTGVVVRRGFKPARGRYATGTAH